MLIYAGIDEAGYGPLLGPLTIGRCVIQCDQAHADALPDLWEQLETAVCRTLSKRRGRLAINDSKKVYTPASGLKHLELGVLAFGYQAGMGLRDLGRLLDDLGETTHRQLADLPWYAAGHDNPWELVPTSCTPGEYAIARSMLDTCCQKVGVRVVDLGAAVVFEDRFNKMVAATRSKAAVSFTFVTQHLQHIAQRYGEHDPVVIVDRQSGRTHYRQPLALAFPEAHMQVLEETGECSSYRMSLPRGGRMTVRFLVSAEAAHMPTALASMLSKYVREMLMARLGRFFQKHAPAIKPTAGYAKDGRRFIEEIRPTLVTLGIEEQRLTRRC